jgi:glutamate racemase
MSGDVPRLVAREYLADFARSEVDTLVLGCTHYPLLKDVIAEAVGPQVSLVDSAEATAEAVAMLLEERGLLAPAGGTPSHAYFVTDVPERFVEVGARFLGRPIHSAEQVDLSF